MYLTKKKGGGGRPLFTRPRCHDVTSYFTATSLGDTLLCLRDDSAILFAYKYIAVTSRGTPLRATVKLARADLAP